MKASELKNKGALKLKQVKEPSESSATDESICPEFTTEQRWTLYAFHVRNIW